MAKGYSARRGFSNGSGQMLKQQQMQQQIMKMQEDMQKAQQEVEEKTFSASVGGGVVSAEVNGKKEVTNITIKPEAVDPEDVEMLQDLIISAVNEALRQAEEAMDGKTNETNALVQKYGEVLDEPLTAEINGHTVSVKALLRDKNTLRVLYDVDNAKGMEPNDLVWDTGAFYLRAADNSGDKRLYIASNAQVGPCYGYAIGSWATRNAVSEGDVLSCYVDIPLTQTATDTRTLYICDLTNHKASAHVKVMLPDMAEAVTLNVKKTIALKGGHWFHYDMTEEEAEQYPDATFDIEEVRIEPLAVSVIGKNHGSLPLGGTSRYDVQSRVKLFRADGTELTYGWDGEFYQGFYGRVSKYSGQSALRVNTYNLIDPEAVAWVEIDGERFEVE